MIVIWILIAMGGRGEISMQTFHSKEVCENARQFILLNHVYFTENQVRCVPDTVRKEDRK